MELITKLSGLEVLTKAKQAAGLLKATEDRPYTAMRSNPKFNPIRAQRS